MITSETIHTDRLVIRALRPSDSAFILELVNTEGWLKFIGDRKVSNDTEAVKYIQNILDNETVTYWVVDQEEISIGVITLIKRDHLPFHDIGFAFLPGVQRHGYAYEASQAIINQILAHTDYTTLLASTKPDNHASIRLIEKLGFTFEETTRNEEEPSNLYQLNLDKVKIDQVIRKFFDAFTNKDQELRLDLVSETCIAETVVINSTNSEHEVYELPGFIAPRRALLTDGTIRDFEEHEIAEKTIITRNIAQRFSTYRKNGIRDGKAFSAKGNKMFQLIKVNTQWKICQVIWDDE